MLWARRATFLLKDMDEILEFIQRRFNQTDANWMNGNCYWFAKILCERFPKLEIYYEPIIGHFMAGAQSTFYDYTGRIVPEYYPILFEDIRTQDELWYEHIIRDCVL